MGKIALKKIQSYFNYRQKYQQKKNFSTPGISTGYSPAPIPSNLKEPVYQPVRQFVPQEQSEHVLHQQILNTAVNPLPNLQAEYHEEYKECPEHAQPVQSQHNISNYNYHQQNSRGKTGFSQPHEIKKANFEQNRRNHISAVSSNIVSSREK